MKIKSDYSNLPQWKEVNVKSSLPKELDCLNELGTQPLVGMEL